MFLSSDLYAATIYSNYSTGNDTTGAGTSVNPYKTFHKAYTSASANDTIDLTGTFDWSNSDETGDSITTGYTLSKSLTITGQSADQTIIQASSTVYTANRRIFSVSGSGTTVTIQNVTLRYGYIASTDYEPSAVNMGSGSVLTILNSIIKQNANNGRFSSGAIEVNGSGKFIVRNSTFDTNNGIVAQQTVGGSYYGYTGALEVLGTNTGNEVTNTTFYNNGAQYNGAIYVTGTGVKLTVTNSTFIANKGLTSGTDIHSYGSAQVYVKNNIFAQKASGATSNLVAQASGTFTDGGNNIVETQGTAGFTNGVNGNLVGVQSSLNIASSLATNNATTGVQTLALSSGSVAINAGTSTSHNSISVPTIDNRQFIRDATVDIGAYEYGATASDSTSPTISSVASTTSSTSATITWTTDESASTKVFFGPTTNYGTTTAEIDTSTRVTSHSISLVNLVSCARYNFYVYSSDASSNIATSSNYTFRTTGCTGSAAIATTTTGTITTASGGSITEGNLTLTVPTSFTTSTSSAIFQASQLDATGFFATAGVPSGKNRAGNTVFNIKALTDATSTLSSFDSSITVALTYTDSDISGLNESSLVIYRYDGSSWYALSSCSVNTSSKTVTCSTTSFSDFAIFGSEPSTSSSSSVGSSGTSIRSRVRNLINMGNIKLAEELIRQYPGAFNANIITSIANSASNINVLKTDDTEKDIKKEEILKMDSVNITSTSTRFMRDLEKYSEGDDVRALQSFLIEQDMGGSAKELARIGVTGYFGQYTKNALGEFQLSVGISPYAGYFGSITRLYIDNILNSR